MTDTVFKSMMTAVSWDPEFKPKVKDLEDYLERITGTQGVSNTDVFMLCLAVGFEMNRNCSVTRH